MLSWLFADPLREKEEQQEKKNSGLGAGEVNYRRVNVVHIHKGTLSFSFDHEATLFDKQLMSKLAQNQTPTKGEYQNVCPVQCPSLFSFLPCFERPHEHRFFSNA